MGTVGEVWVGAGARRLTFFFLVFAIVSPANECVTIPPRTEDAYPNGTAQMCESLGKRPLIICWVLGRVKKFRDKEKTSYGNTALCRRCQNGEEGHRCSWL